MLDTKLLQSYLLYFCIVISSLPCNSLESSELQCKFRKPCQCVFENNMGIDLRELQRNSQWLNASKDNQTFYFHPCSDLALGNSSNPNNCTPGASLCLFTNVTKSYSVLGYANETSIVSSGPNNLQYKYKHKDIETIVDLQCANGTTSLSIVSSNKLLLLSPSVCLINMLYQDSPDSSSSLSTGSVLVILLLVFSSLYFVGGALALKFLRGAEGREMIPNLDFWTSLPGLVKEGFLFTINGCKPAPAYDRI